MTIEFYMSQGIAQANEGNFSEAIAAFNQAIKLRPDPDVYYNLAILQVLVQQPADAKLSLQRAIELRADFFDAYNNLGVILKTDNDLAAAEVCFRRAIQFNPRFAEAYYNLGLTQTKLNCLAEAVASYFQAIELRPAYPEAYNNLGSILKAQNHFAEAEDCFRQAIELNPDFPEAYNNLGAVLKDENKLAEAEGYLRRAIELRPLYAEAFNNLGLVLRNKNSHDEAEKYLCLSIELSPDSSEAYSNLGLVLTDVGRLIEAEVCLCRALELCPDFPAAEYALATLYFLQGNYAKAWGKYESRFQVFHNYQPPLRRWTGEDLTGRKILLFCEQGLGDTLQFMRYVPQVAALASQTVVWVQQPLFPLLTDSSSTFSIYSGDVLPPGDYDFACPLLSLPLVFGTSSATIPRDIPYLRPSVEACRKWQDKLAAMGDGTAYRVGVAWAGNPNQTNDYKRSIPFEQFARLFVNDQVSWVNLQVGKRAQDLAGTEYPVKDYSEQFVDFLETAGVIANLDLVITADTSVAHLSGAMGKPTWLLLSFAPDWRWQLGREDSPWYPTMRIFRQREMDNWSEVLQRVTAALEREYIGST